jgi:hypothetical protein
MRIGFDVNGVLRDTFLKSEQIYQKFYIDEFDKEKTSQYNEETKEFEEELDEDTFEYSLNLPVTSLDNLEEHFRFPNKEDIFNFFYVDFPMQIFGHALSTTPSTFNDLNDIYEKLRDEHDLLIVSDEIQKSKPATLFFLSKYGSLIEKIKFYSNITINNMWDEVDILVTANPNLLKNPPYGKIVVKFETTYNGGIDSNFTIKDIKEFMEVYKKLK